MTASEAIKKGIKKIRLPEWAEGCFIELPILPDGTITPWAMLHDPYFGNVEVPVWKLTGDSCSRYETHE